MLKLELNESSRNELKALLREVIQEELLKVQFQSNSSNTKEVKELLTRKEAMDLLNCSHATLYRYQRDKEVPYSKVGNKVLFNRSELLNFIKLHRN